MWFCFSFFDIKAAYSLVSISLEQFGLPCRQVELCLLCVGLLYSLRLLECAKLRRHFYFCMVEQFFNGKYLDAGIVFIPAWGMVKSCADCFSSHIFAR